MLAKIRRTCSPVTTASRRACLRPQILTLAACGIALRTAFALQAGAPGSTAAPGSDRFPPASVTIYDFDATSFQPSPTAADGDAGINYGQFYAAASNFYETARTSDSSHARLKLFDVSFPPGAASIRPGPSFAPFFPSPNDEPATDYIVVGKISGVRGAYTLSVAVKDAKTREEVATTSVPFATPVEAANAGKVAESQLAPLAARIEAFQRRKRDADPATAINAQLTVTPAKAAVKIGEATSVKLVLTDLDGIVLKNRKIGLAVDGPGTVAPAEVMTDERGEAQATFNGVGHAGPATVLVTYGYTNVTHHEAFARNGWASIQVGGAPADVWEVRVSMTEHSEESTASAMPDSKEAASTSTDTKIGMVGWLSARQGASVGSVESQNLIAQSGGGDYMQTVTSAGRKIDLGNGAPVNTSKGYTSVPGHFAPQQMSSQSMSFIINPPYKGNPQYKIKPAPGSFLVAINGLPVNAMRHGHTVKTYYGVNPHPPDIDDRNDLQQVRTGLFTASGVTTPEIQATRRYTLFKKLADKTNGGGTDEAVYTITLRPLNHG